MAALFVRSGKRTARESASRRPVFDAIRLLAKPIRQKRTMLRDAKILLAAWKETTIIETVFDGAGARDATFKGAHPSEFEFIRLLEAIVEGREVDLCRLREIAAALTPFISLTRGPKISAPSASHEALLRFLDELRRIRGVHSRRRGSRYYADPATTATQKEFANDSFDSRSARRRRKRAQRTAGDSLPPGGAKARGMPSGRGSKKAQLVP
jgi:hypothetical protein